MDVFYKNDNSPICRNSLSCDHSGQKYVLIMRVNTMILSWNKAPPSREQGTTLKKMKTSFFVAFKTLLTLIKRIYCVFLLPFNMLRSFLFAFWGEFFVGTRHPRLENRAPLSTQLWTKVRSHYASKMDARKQKKEELPFLSFLLFSLLFIFKYIIYYDF